MLCLALARGSIFVGQWALVSMQVVQPRDRITLLTVLFLGARCTSSAICWSRAVLDPRSRKWRAFFWSSSLMKATGLCSIA